jgi:hypothetical protein
LIASIPVAIWILFFGLIMMTRYAAPVLSVEPIPPPPSVFGNSKR